jgi:hypothetical protein
MFPRTRDLGGFSRAARCSFISVVSVANCGASPVANLRAANLCMSNRRVAFVNDYRAVMCFTSSVAVPAFVITATIIAFPITITSAVIASRIMAITVDPGSVTTVARGCIGGAPTE